MEKAGRQSVSPQPRFPFVCGDLRRPVGNVARLLLVCLAVLPLVRPAGASAQEAPRPLEFEVRPSGVIAETPEERLDRRLREREYLFRSICIHCSRGDRFSSTAPFRPLETLGLPGQRSEQD